MGVTLKVQDLYEEFFSRAQKRGVQVVLIYSPELAFSQDIGSRGEFKKVLEIAGKYRVPLLAFDANRHPEFKGKTYFHDRTHLNEKGAELYSKIFASELVSLLQGSAKKALSEF